MDDEVAHGAVLSLVNQHMMTQAPAEVYAAFERAATRTTQWGGLAGWFLDHHRDRGWHR